MFSNEIPRRFLKSSALNPFETAKLGHCDNGKLQLLDEGNPPAMVCTHLVLLCFTVRQEIRQLVA